MIDSNHKSEELNDFNNNDAFRAEEKRIRFAWRQIEAEQQIRQRKKTFTQESFCDTVVDWLRKNDIQTFPNIFDSELCTYTANEVNGLSDGSGISRNARVFSVPFTPQGLYLIKNALNFDKQLFWAKMALEKYSGASHTNLTNLTHLNADNPSEISSNSTPSLWEESIADNNDYLRFKKMRWASLGYHYDWTARKYQEDLKSTFPEDLARYCKNLAKFASHDLDQSADASIVNYYPSGTSMSGHIDDAELAMEEPIVSMSLGCPAIFLIGGRTKDIHPTSILLESGDVIVMSGESRYCYHGVPIVLPHYKCLNAFLNVSEESEYRHTAGYLQQCRININTRRVLPANSEWYDKHGSGAKPPVAAANSTRNEQDLIT